MFTPQRKAPWAPPTSAQRTTATGSISRFTVADKGKSVAFFDGPPPPRSSLDGEVIRRGENAEDWLRFKEAGLLDESSLERKDRQALLDKLSKLEKELFDYQYNMGLLLLEKKDLVSQNEELGQELAEAEEILKREQAAHLIAISEAEKREENLKKALDIEKKCLADLEQAVRDMHEERAKLKATSETAVTNVSTRMEALEKKRVDIEAKAHLAEAKLSAAERKNSELDRKMHELEVRESTMQRERLLLAEEKESHKTYLQKQKDDFVEWERKLQEGEQRLCNSRRALKEREEELFEIDRTSQEKKAYLDELQRKINSGDATLKKMEEDMKSKSAELDLKEKSTEGMRRELEVRVKELQEKEEKLNERERVGLENLLNKHRATLDAEMRKLESVANQNREAFEAECNSRRLEIDQKELEIKHLEAKMVKREQALEKKSDRLKAKEKDVEAKLEDLKEREWCIKAEEKKLEAEREKLKNDTESLEDLRKELDKWKSNLRNQELQIEEEQKKLESLQAERSECLHLKSNLKQAFENARRQSELIEKEAEDLKLEREKFEKDWDALDEKRAALDNDILLLAEEKTSFEKLRNSEEDRLKRERAEAEEHLRLESERIRLEKESFEVSMEHQRKMSDEKAKDDHRLMCHDLEREREAFLSDMQKKQREWAESMEEKERAFEERMVRETQNISYLKKDVETKLEEMEIERCRLEKEREELEVVKNELEETSFGMSKDIEALDILRKTMKKQREEFSSERRLFFAFIEKIKCCRNCGEFLNHDLQLSSLEGSPPLPKPSRHGERDAEDEPAPRELSSQLFPSPAAITSIIPRLSGQMSVLQKCASLFKSPKSKTDDHITEESPNSAVEVTANVNRSSRVGHGSHEVNLRAQDSAADECGPSFRILEDSLKVPASDVIVTEETVDTSQSFDVSNIEGTEQGLQPSEKSNSKTVGRKPGRKRAPGVRRTHSVKAVVEDAKAILGESSFRGNVEQPFDIAEGDVKEASTVAHPKLSVGARKRSHSQASRVTESEQDFEHSEGIADSVATGGQRKRRQTSATTLSTPGQRRYNLRRHTVPEIATTEQALSGKAKNKGKVPRSSTDQAVQNSEETASQPLDIALASGRRSNLVQVSTTRSIELTSERVVRFDTSAAPVDEHVDATKSLETTLSEAHSGRDTNLSEEVSENEDDRDGGSSSGDANEDEGKGEDADSYDDHPGQASVGKKIWKFLTT